MQRIVFAIVCALTLLAACDNGYSYACADGTCLCARGERCAIACHAPPCHLQCVAENPECSGECANGECVCGPDSSCDFGCQSPPCHVSCDPASRCSGECANGTCACDRGASCEFACGSGPCHVQCAGDNPNCNGECANGSCTCGPRSTCHFACTDHNCSASCSSGSHCVLACPQGRAGTPGCAFTSCAAGTPMVCPDGVTTTCDAACP